jgi:hypothetical protein
MENLLAASSRMETSIPFASKTSAMYSMPSGGHAVTTISGVPGEGLGFMSENFISIALQTLLKLCKISFTEN